ncbi:peptidylprolyl isomerase [bacterium]|nr:peptidylprolyl isomerase [bacterium]
MRNLILLVFISLLIHCFGQNIVATVDGVKITEEEFLNDLKKFAGEPILKEMIDNILVEKEAQKEGISITPEELQIRLEIFRRLNTPPGVDFAKDLLNNGTTLARLTNAFRLGLLLDKLVAKKENITISDEEIENEFKKVNKERHTYCILVKTEEDALTVHKKLTEGSYTFSEVAQQYSQEPESKAKGGDLGWIRKGTLPPYFDQVIFSLKKGEISDPIWTRYGFYFFKVEEERTIQLTPQIKEELRQSLLTAKVGLRRFMLLDELRSKAKIEISVRFPDS